MYERACETVNTCMVDQRSFKAYLARWMAATTQMAPFTYDFIMPKLRASAAAAAKTCTGGNTGTSCGLKWTEQQWDGSKGIGEQMSAMEVFQSNLITKVAPPVTNSTGGTSKGNPSAGSEGDGPPGAGPLPKIYTDPITTGDRAGAGILTTLVLVVFIACTWWMISE
jgi:mannan endo-1,6-alpha-mannosidase